MKKLFMQCMMLFFALSTAYGQSMVSGNITDDAGLALIGANVLVKGTTIGTTTDVDGNFSIEVPADNNTLTVSYTGYATQDVDISTSSLVSIRMSEGEVLNEIVITALGIEREEKSLGYAVTKIDGEDITKAKETNIVNSLQGKIAGVQIAGSPSTLGGSSRITIRGANSFLGNNQPLFVIDGIPVNNSNLSGSSQQRGFGGSFAYDYGNAISDLDPESVEDLTVLKGAAATALYGSRGANGVILVTTKSGKGKKGLGIEFSNQLTAETVRNLIPHQQLYGGGDIVGTASGFNEVIQDGVTYLTPIYAKDGAWGPRYDPNVMVRHWDSWDPDNAATYKQTRPWVAPSTPYEDFFETGLTRTTSIGFTGGTDQGSFRLGYTNLDATGTIPNGKLGRNSFTLNSSYDVTDRISVNVKGNYVITEAENRNVTGYNNANPLQAFTQWWQTQLDVDRLKSSTNRLNGQQYTWNAIGPIVDGDGNLISYNHTPQFFDNPHWVRNNFLQEDIRNRFIGGAGINFDLGRGFSVTGNFGTDFYRTSDMAAIPVGSVEQSEYRERQINFTETNYEGRINYNGSLSDDFSLTAFVGGNIMRQKSRTSSAQTVGGLSLANFYNISNSAESPLFTTFESNRGINSVFGSISLGFKNWMYLDVTVRNDWSSTLPEDENSYFYPSATVSAVLSDLPGFNSNAISFLKVRAGYAQAGNDADPYRLTDVFDPLVPNYGSFPRYGVPNSRNNASLRPELTTEVEFGVDARFFNDRLGIDAAYFNRNTTDQIFSVPSSAATGYTSRILNSGEMENSGIELQLYGTPIKGKNFNVNMAFNISRLYNKVVSLADGVESINMGGTWAADLRVQEGEKYMALYGQNYVFDDNGN
ncbi:MAG: SusC/RagA family TonB-linked outer membrane protein, partial [Bacteroidota bacterium]